MTKLFQYLRDILSTLTPDDVRHLIQSEDELTQSGDMERIFPTPETHKYLGFLAGPRYYNRLFDAWETRYGRNREPGECGHFYICVDAVLTDGDVRVD